MSNFTKTYQKIVILTGAGISAESGIKTFRGSNGMWENHRIEDVATPEAFIRDPELVQNFYNERRRQLLNPEIQPNAAHIALAQLEKNFFGEFLLITQNIDNLHERAGSKNIIHMHGELLKARCRATDQVYDLKSDLQIEDRCYCCDKAGYLRPHVVWFGEMPLEMKKIHSALSGCDLFIAVGTSGNVYPAAGFVQIANSVGADTIEVNLEPSLIQSSFTQRKYGKATETLPELVNEILLSSTK